MSNPSEITIKRKYRWSIQCFNIANEITLPETFIKVGGRPDFPYEAVADENGGRIQQVPGIFSCYQIIESSEYFILDKLEFEDNNCLAKIKNVAKVILRCYNGAGEVNESWVFNETKMEATSVDHDYSSGCIEIAWAIYYQKSEYKSYQPIPKAPVPNNSKVRLVIHEDGQATLTIDGLDTHVGRSSGLDEAISRFNNEMKKRHWSYRLKSGYPEVFRDILGLDPIKTCVVDPTEEQLVAIENKIQEIRARRAQA